MEETGHGGQGERSWIGKSGGREGRGLGVRRGRFQLIKGGLRRIVRGGGGRGGEDGGRREVSGYFLFILIGIMRCIGRSIIIGEAKVVETIVDAQIRRVRLSHGEGAEKTTNERSMMEEMKCTQYHTQL